MAYCTIDDYTGVYKGHYDIPSADFDALAERASEVIDSMTNHALMVGGGLDDLPQWIVKQVIKATCAQVEFLYINGYDAAVSGGQTGTYSIGTTSITKNASDADSANKCRLVRRLLEPTGLLYRGVDVC